MNLLDILIAVFCIGLALSGLFQGLVRQLSSWMGLVLGHLAGVRYYPVAQRFLKLDFPHADLAGYLAVFLAVYILARILGALVERWVRGSKLSGTDRMVGGTAGFLKGVLLSILLVFALTVLLPRDARFLKESKLAPRVVVAARWMEPVFPERIRAAFRSKLHPEEAPAGQPQGKAAEGTKELRPARPGTVGDGGTNGRPAAPRPKRQGRKASPPSAD